MDTKEQSIIHSINTCVWEIIKTFPQFEEIRSVTVPRILDYQDSHAHEPINYDLLAITLYQVVKDSAPYKENQPYFDILHAALDLADYKNIANYLVIYIKSTLKKE